MLSEAMAPPLKPDTKTSAGMRKTEIYKLSRDQLLSELASREIPVPPSATVGELRSLLSELLSEVGEASAGRGMAEDASEKPVALPHTTPSMPVGYLKCQSKVLIEILGRIPICDGQNHTDLFRFLVEVNRASCLKLVSETQFLTLCLTKTSGFLTELFSQGIQANLSLRGVIDLVLGALLPGRTKQKLCREVVHRFQSPHESFRNFVLSITEAARVLNADLEELELVDIILENVSPLTRRHFVFSGKPTSIQDLYSLASVIEGTLLAEKEYLDTHSPAVKSRERTGLSPGAACTALPFERALPARNNIPTTGDNHVGGNRGDRAPRDLSRVRCYRCNRLGHVRRQCVGGNS